MSAFAMHRWLVHTRSLQGGDGESLQLSAEAAAERDALVLPSIEEVTPFAIHSAARSTI